MLLIDFDINSCFSSPQLLLDTKNLVYRCFGVYTLTIQPVQKANVYIFLKKNWARILVCIPTRLVSVGAMDQSPTS